ncbi:Metal-dependent hydrolase YbeY, involved in rRNA and/or ribosome maturation and assembly [Clostridiaceae bacterium JG1575]|nr:Metal-dependent hydrolase YbeY, involved in rRNA and/or ribosome maturation and assembly [Clostridiaceae bacterium JG1575]
MVVLESLLAQVPLSWNELGPKMEEALTVLLRREDAPLNSVVSLSFVSSQEIQRINDETRGKNQVTDVLSFPALSYPEGETFQKTYSQVPLGDEYFQEGMLFLGEVLICTERASEQAVAYGHSHKREAVFLFVHSVLHLLGYDHEREQDRAHMEEVQRQIMEQVGVGR